MSLSHRNGTESGCYNPVEENDKSCTLGEDIHSASLTTSDISHVTIMMPLIASIKHFPDSQRRHTSGGALTELYIHSLTATKFRTSDISHDTITMPLTASNKPFPASQRRHTSRGALTEPYTHPLTATIIQDFGYLSCCYFYLLTVPASQT